jgi:hypothetical protein
VRTALTYFLPACFAPPSGCGRPARATTTRGRELLPLNHDLRKVRDWGTRVAGWLHLSPFRYEPRESELPLPLFDTEGVFLAHVTEVGRSKGDLDCD